MLQALANINCYSESTSGQTDSIPISSSFCAFACNSTTMGCSSTFCSTTAGSNKTVELVRRSLTLTAPLSTLPSPILDCCSRPVFAEQHDVRTVITFVTSVVVWLGFLGFCPRPAIAEQHDGRTVVLYFRHGCHFMQEHTALTPLKSCLDE